MTKKGKKRILLVEDDMNLGFVIQDTLARKGYKVHLCRDGKDGLKYYNSNPYDLCIFDVMLPEKDGFSLAEDIRRTDEQIPIIFLSAKSMTEDRIQGFKSGGDDYITKPFSNEELILRIEAILRRTSEKEGGRDEKDIFQLGKFTFDYRRFALKIGKEERKLTKKEAEVLRLLCMHNDQVLPRDLVLNMVWGDDSYFLGRSLDVFISKLRKYLKEDESVQIVNVHGVGFRLQCD